jgi:hypothetical protein
MRTLTVMEPGDFPKEMEYLLGEHFFGMNVDVVLPLKGVNDYYFKAFNAVWKKDIKTLDELCKAGVLMKDRMPNKMGTQVHTFYLMKGKIIPEKHTVSKTQKAWFDLREALWGFCKDNEIPPESLAVDVLQLASNWNTTRKASKSKEKSWAVDDIQNLVATAQVVTGVTPMNFGVAEQNLQELEDPNNG